ncbi:efflux RND transporter periplasmic adaptor subunit [Roseovarius salis]|uniref:efflux RND transporter periplasmic adaptor subunit n=1 Tax=Roseovarius salis TaxID=3376063 RepID=UPI0037C61C74
MRLFPILAAIVVVAGIYAFVFERERIRALLPGPTAQQAQLDGADAQDARNSGAARPDDAPISVVAVKSVARRIDEAVILRGRTEADRQVDLRAETSGQIVSDPLRKGSFVEAGDVLCELDPGTRQSALAEARARLNEARARVPEARARVPEAEARVAQARAQLEEAKSRLNEAKINANAAKRLSEDGFASQTRVAATEAAVRGAEAAIQTARAALKAAESNRESVTAGIESAKAGVESAQAAVAAASREIERLTITAPFGGLLESDSAELGSLLQPGSLCATVIRLDPMMLVGFVPETQVSRIETGARADARLASGEEVQGEVVFISRAADPATRTFRVEIEVPNPDLALRDGQTVEISVSADGTQAHLLPQSALTLNDEGKLGVRTVDTDGRVAFRAVTLVRDTPTGVWLTGLPETSDVIIIGQEYVAEGVRVEPTYRELGQ